MTWRSKSLTTSAEFFAYNVLEASPTLSLCGALIRSRIFRCGGTSTSTEVNTNKHPQRFVSIVVGYAPVPRKVYLNPSIKSESSSISIGISVPSLIVQEQNQHFILEKTAFSQHPQSRAEAHMFVRQKESEHKLNSVCKDS